MDEVYGKANGKQKKREKFQLQQRRVMMMKKTHKNGKIKR